MRQGQSPSVQFECSHCRVIQFTLSTFNLTVEFLQQWIVHEISSTFVLILVLRSNCLVWDFPFFPTKQFQTNRASSTLERIAAQQLGRTVGSARRLDWWAFFWGWRLPCRNWAGVQLGWSFGWQDSKVYYKILHIIYYIFFWYVSIIYPTTYISQFLLDNATSMQARLLHTVDCRFYVTSNSVHPNGLWGLWAVVHATPIGVGGSLDICEIFNHDICELRNFFETEVSVQRFPSLWLQFAGPFS